MIVKWIGFGLLVLLGYGFFFLVWVVIPWHNRKTRDEIAERIDVVGDADRERARERMERYRRGRTKP